ncbi:MAG: sugar phosphate isomerase/epimerase family protein [bacterium]
MATQRHTFGLCMYGIQYLVGPKNPNPLTSAQFADLAAENGLSALEVPLHYMSPGMEPKELADYAARARDRGMDIVIAGPNLARADDVPQQLELAAHTGTRVFRCVTSPLLEGNREPMGGYDGWQRHLDSIIAKLRELAPRAEALGIRIGIENHQDADSADLVRVCETVGSPNVGVTLDAGNPLAVGEDPIEFATRILPYLVDIHLKDYRMILTNEGYRLVHCAIGDGVVDFAALWPLFDSKPEVPRSIEMAALNERHVKLLTDAWWEGYPARDVRTIVPVMRIMHERGEPDGDPLDWQTPIERGDLSRAVEWETERFERSVANLARIEQEAGR